MPSSVLTFLIRFISLLHPIIILVSLMSIYRYRLICHGSKHTANAFSFDGSSLTYLLTVFFFVFCFALRCLSIIQVCLRCQLLCIFRVSLALFSYAKAPNKQHPSSSPSSPSVSCRSVRHVSTSSFASRRGRKPQSRSRSWSYVRKEGAQPQTHKETISSTASIANPQFTVPPPLARFVTYRPQNSSLN